MATTFRSTVLFTASLAIAAGTWVISGQNTTGPQYETVRYTNDGLRLEAYLYTPAGLGPSGQQVGAHGELRITCCRPEDVVTYGASCSKRLERVRIEAHRPQSLLPTEHDVAGTAPGHALANC